MLFRIHSIYGRPNKLLMVLMGLALADFIVQMSVNHLATCKPSLSIKLIAREGLSVVFSCPSGEYQSQLRYMLYLSHHGCVLPRIPLANYLPPYPPRLNFVEVGETTTLFEISWRYPNTPSYSAGSYPLYARDMLGQLHEFRTGVATRSLAVQTSKSWLHR